MQGTVEPESGGGRDGTRRHGSPDASASTSLSSRGGGSAGGSCSKQVVHLEIRCTEIRLQHELSWMQVSDDGHDGSRAH